MIVAMFETTFHLIQSGSVATLSNAGSWCEKRKRLQQVTVVNAVLLFVRTLILLTSICHLVLTALLLRKHRVSGCPLTGREADLMRLLSDARGPATVAFLLMSTMELVIGRSAALSRRLSCRLLHLLMLCLLSGVSLFQAIVNPAVLHLIAFPLVISQASAVCAIIVMESRLQLWQQVEQEWWESSSQELETELIVASSRATSVTCL